MGPDEYEQVDHTNPSKPTTCTQQNLTQQYVRIVYNIDFILPVPGSIFSQHAC